MKVAVLGLGSIGMRHAQNFRALGVTELIGMDPSEDRRTRFAAKFDATTVSGLAEAIGAGPDLAVIASPNVHHIPQAHACAAAGIPLLIEKPLGASLKGVDELLARVEERGLYAHVGSNWKFHPAFTTMKRLIETSSVGPIVAVQILAGQWLPDWHPWEDYRQGYSARADLGGGIVLDSHELDYVTWLLGPVRRLTGAVARTGALETSTEDVACAALAFESGALGTLQVDYIQRQARRRYCITGVEGTIVWDLTAQSVDVFRPGGGGPERHPAEMADLNEMYLAQSQHVLEGVRGRAAPVTPLAHAAHALALQIAWQGLVA